ncbi:2'-5' RNA ligase family protein [Haladaptatus sp. GCM10025707]|uniref:2'-5' RNA ligase family protein n=1 Tax=unclassified Haladaptatus TaxID=2622732 RepID=UPI0023E7A8E9|nr:MULTISPECIES: 2'-5' RNA ligase family protein [unclassified Haladaptatus]
MSIIVGALLPDPYYERIESVWADIEAEFGANGIHNPFPHFTQYGVTEPATVPVVESALEAVVARHDPVTVRTDGIGIFPGNTFYIPVTQSRALAQLHEDVVDDVSRLGDAPSSYYEPGSWFPHVGLAIQIPDANTGDLASFLLDYDFSWEFDIETLAVMAWQPEDATFTLETTHSLSAG